MARELFISLLKESAELWDIRISAYCLMTTHYHILAQTLLGNLSRFMRHFNGVYTQRYNCLHGHDGQLFRDSAAPKSNIYHHHNLTSQTLKFIL